MMIGRLAMALLMVVAVSTPPAAEAQSRGAGPKLRTIETRYYTIYTDLPPEQAREAAIRMTAMAEEYQRRMRDFGGKVTKKLPFYLYSDPEDYYATGAPRQSAGRFNGNVLLAVAEDFGPKTWHIVQHEGFHQFAAAVISAHLPPWVNEGMAEYFGEGLFTGDGYVTGVIPQWRLERIRKRFENNEFKPMRDFMQMQLNDWNSAISLVNYDQAWSIVQFLAHGDGGRYQRTFSAFMGLLGRGQHWQRAWQVTFGDLRAFEQRWREYWTSLPDDPAAELYVEATVATLTSFVARAVSQQQSFSDLDDFARAAQGQEVKHHPDDWLPPRLLAAAVKSAQNMSAAGHRFELIQPSPGALPQVRCTLKSGGHITGSFALRQGKVQKVTTVRSGPPSRS